MVNKIAVVDIFCGIGGLTQGFIQEKIQVVAGIDNDSSCKYAYENNNKTQFLEKDINDVKGKEIRALYPKGAVKVLVGCAPCQTFSQHTMKNKDREKDDRWRLLYQFLRIVREAKPDIVSMENVPQLRKYKIFNDFVKGLKKEGYFVQWRIVNCPRYGVPQRRIRLVLLASKLGIIDLIKETNEPSTYLTVRDSLGNLSAISDGEVSKKDSLHRSWKLSAINKKRIKQSKAGGSWLDWSNDLVLKCHKKKNGATYKAVYGRMRWDHPSPTITTQFYSYGTGRFGHPEQNRAISLREGALLQTFPKRYKFFKKGEKVSFSVIGRHIGNAVPVQLGRVIAQSIKNHVTYALK